MPFDVLQADGIGEDECLESPALIRTGSEAHAHNAQKANPATDEKIQDMMGFLNDDDKETDCFFGIKETIGRKKSHTAEYTKRPPRINVAPTT